MDKLTLIKEIERHIWAAQSLVDQHYTDVSPKVAKWVKHAWCVTSEELQTLRKEEIMRKKEG